MGKKLEQQRIAIVGIGGIFPDAPDTGQFWENILAGKDSAREPAPGRWSLSLADAYGPEQALDKVYSRRGCFIDECSLDTDGLALSQAYLNSLDPGVQLLLYAGRQAWRDAVTERVDLERVGVIIGNIVLPTESASAIASEIILPRLEREYATAAAATPQTNRMNRYVAGLPAGVLARALKLGGGAYTLDAACASSLYALKYAVAALQAGRADAMLCGGLSRPDCLYTQMGFSSLHAISASGHCSPFDKKSDGLVVGEGAGIVVLKRLQDAINTGDHIYATIAGIGLSNDVKGNLMSPDAAGQLRAMEAAYKEAGWRPDTIDLIECHGTGTPVGDKVEFNSLKTLWAGIARPDRACVIGSVKSNVGHLLTAAGSAGLIKVLMAFKHNTLPPTANFESAAAGIDLAGSPFTVLNKPRAWQPPSNHSQPRRAAISAFGFGGINAHVLLEAWQETSPRRSSSAIKLTAPAQQPEIAIVGMDACFGPWESLAAFQQRIFGEASREPVMPNNWWGVENRDGIKGYFIDKVDIPLGRFRIPPTELEEMLPQQLLMLQVAANAIDDAGLDREDLDAWLNTGVYIGIGLDFNTTNFQLRWSLLNKARQWNRESGYQLDEDQLQAWVAELRAAVSPPLTANRTMGALGGIVASRVARAFNMGGPSFTLSSEESSGMRALQSGMRALQRGELDSVVVGAVDLAGDVRAALGQHSHRPYSRQGVGRPFAMDADGPVIGEGATALVLKRYDDAVKAGDRIYAKIKGVGGASGGAVEQQVAADSVYVNAVHAACADAGVTLDSISYIEGHGSASPQEDSMEIAALTALFAGSQRDIPCALGSCKGDIGHTGAAAALASVAKTALSLYHRIIPPLKGGQPLHSGLQQQQSSLHVPTEPCYWLRNRAAGPRRAMVSAFSVDGNCVHAILEGDEQRSDERRSISPLRLNTKALFTIEADTTGQLLQALNRFADMINAATATDIHTLARQWWQTERNRERAALSLNIVTADTAALNKQLASVKQAIQKNRRITGDGVFYSPQPLGRQGKLAFLFPGSGNHFSGMGRELGCHWLGALQRLDEENANLARQFANAKFWMAAQSYRPDHIEAIFGQVWLGAMVSDVVSSFGIRPDAIIGYSLGETAGLFATRTWRDRDGMWQRMHETDLFTRQLAGPCESVRRSWGLADSENVDWAIGVVNTAVERVRQALEGRARVYLLIINTPNECVIGGDRTAVRQLVNDLNCGFHPIEGVTTVHCEVADPVKAPYRDLHLFPSTPPAGVSFYSGILGRSYGLDRDSAADSIVGQALEPFDYTRVINSAYADGVRLFIEMGPGASCSRMIDQILGEREHYAGAICVKGVSESAALLNVLAQLNAERVEMDLSPLFELPAEARTEVSNSVITVPVGHKPLQLPRIRQPVQEASGELKEKVAEVVMLDGRLSSREGLLGGVIEQMAVVEVAQGEAQETFLRVSNGISETLGRALHLQMSLLQSLPGGAVIDSTGIAPIETTPVVFDRDQCMELAIGQLGRVLGPQFAEIDTFPTRVRLPDEPLMLVDRILAIQGEPCSMGPGAVVTEHDVLPGAWYLDGGRIPTCIAVEAGQADLFLSGYLGIDLKTRGLAVYRLLDAEITFHGPLPRPGETIHYDIHIDHFFRQGDTYLFRFYFDGTVDGRPLLTMRNGCAGFFTQGELDAGKGIVQTDLEKQAMEGKRPGDWKALVPMQREHYSDAQLDALRAGDLAGCFGAAFQSLGLHAPVGLPSGRMTLVHRVLDLDPEGGRYGLGIITGEADIHSDDWFLTCHFVDDRVMPGTLMYECCLHTLRIYLLRMGWVGETGEFVYEPVPGVRSKLKCRGQVIESTNKVQYEITLKEIGYTAAGTPYVLADALMYADGRPIVQMGNMSLRLSGLTRERIETIWHDRPTAAPGKRPAIFDYESILAFSDGNPSEAFGERYKVFDKERVIARLPRPPYQFLDRIVSIKDCQPWQLAAGGVIEAEYDVPGDAWYFAENRQDSMPFAVLLEVALQPCGWLAAYLGSALTSTTDLSFRNLGGSATQLQSVGPDTGTLTTTIKITNVSQSGGMIIQHYDMEMRSARGVVYRGTTYFGFFTKEALANQIGIRDVTPFEPPPGLEPSHRRAFDYPDHAPYPKAMMRMVDRIVHYDSQGGPNGLGFIRGTARVNPEAWFFKAHFYQDPVWPGSLGLESLIQLLKVIAVERWGDDIDKGALSFQSMALGEEHHWTYRGQILPEDGEVTIQAVVTGIDDQQKMVTADGFLTVDGRIIYQMNDFTLKMEP